MTTTPRTQGGGWLDAGPGVRTQVAGPLPARLAQMHAHGTVIASVCTGRAGAHTRSGLTLAPAGALTERR